MSNDTIKTADNQKQWGWIFDPSIGEWLVIVAGQVVNYATHESTAYHQFTEACRVYRRHLQSNPTEA